MKRALIAVALLSIVLLASAPSVNVLAMPSLPNVESIHAEQSSSYNLSLAVPAYYVQESGDIILFFFIAVDSAGTKVAVTLGNGTTGWHFSGATWMQEYFDPKAKIGVEGDGYLVVAALLMKNVWPSGWRIVDQCFGMVPEFSNETSMPYAVTFNQDFRMILIYSVEAGS